MPMLRIGSALSIGLVVSGMPFEPESTSQRAASWNVSIALRLGLWHDGFVRATRMWACNAEVTLDAFAIVHATTRLADFLMVFLSDGRQSAGTSDRA